MTLFTPSLLSEQSEQKNLQVPPCSAMVIVKTNFYLQASVTTGLALGFGSAKARPLVALKYENKTYKSFENYCFVSTS